MKWIGNLVTLRFTGMLLLGVLAGWLCYLLLGHHLVELIYTGSLGPITERLMPGKSTTPLEAYLEAADALIVLVTIVVLTVFLIIACLIKKPLLLLYSSCVFASLSFVLFCVVELFPSVAYRLYLDRIGSHYYDKLYIADGELVHRLRPGLRAWTRTHYDDSPFVYGIQVQPNTVEWLTDEDGFRNIEAATTSDVIVIGDGFIEEGQNLADTFANRLERHLLTVTVANLGTGGYGPFQYLEVLKRYGLKRKPKYALIAFNEVNDILDIERYLQWHKAKKKGESVRYDLRTAVISRGFFERYVGMLSDGFHETRRIILTAANLLLENLRTRQRRPIHKDVALIALKEGTHKILFIDKLLSDSSANLTASDSGQQLTALLFQFKTLCARNNIIPMIMFIPAAAHIYAEYSTEKSGRNWLRIRSEQIAARKNGERAISTLAHALGIQFISLSTVFESAAMKGKMLYRPLSTHWNSEGMAVAAAFMAEVLEPKLR